MIVRETFFVFVIIKKSSHFLKSPERVTIENKAVTYFPITKPKELPILPRVEIRDRIEIPNISTYHCDY